MDTKPRIASQAAKALEGAARMGRMTPWIDKSIIQELDALATELRKVQ